jgi:ACS family glucarate transporter-like MFS transporter
MSDVPSPYEPPPLKAKSGRTYSRLVTLALLVGMAMLLYLTRFAPSPATDQMTQDLGVTREEFGRAVASFFFAYALLQIPAGLLLDFWSVRWPLAIFVFGWSIATGLMSLVDGLTGIMLCRIALGFTQAGAYPAAAAAIGRWFPKEERARANSSVATGGRAGGLIALALTPILMALLGGWRIAFALYGVLGIFWAIAFVLWYRDSPEEHPFCGPAEAKRILAGRDDAPASSISWAALLANRNVWLLAAINFLLNVGWIFLVTWMPTYLNDRFPNELIATFGSRDVASGILTAVTAIAGMAGNLGGGFLADFLLPRLGPVWARRLPGLCSAIGAAALYALAPAIGRPLLFVAAMALVYFLADLSVGALWATYQDVGGKLTASMLGWVNMCGNLGAAACVWQIGYLAEKRAWGIVFAISAVSLLFCGLCWLGVDPNVRLARRNAAG